MSEWLLKKLFQTKDQVTPRFAFLGTVNWMRGLSIIVNLPLFSEKAIADHYSSVSRRYPVQQKEDALVMENV